MICRAPTLVIRAPTLVIRASTLVISRHGYLCRRRRPFIEAKKTVDMKTVDKKTVDKKRRRPCQIRCR